MSNYEGFLSRDEVEDALYPDGKPYTDGPVFQLCDTCVADDGDAPLCPRCNDNASLLIAAQRVATASVRAHVAREALLTRERDAARVQSNRDLVARRQERAAIIAALRERGDRLCLDCGCYDAAADKLESGELVPSGAGDRLKAEVENLKATVAARQRSLLQVHDDLATLKEGYQRLDDRRADAEARFANVLSQNTLLLAEIERLKNPNPTIGEPRNKEGDPFINGSDYIAHHLWDLLRMRGSGQDWWADVRNWCQRRLTKEEFERPLSPDAWKTLTPETLDALRSEAGKPINRAMMYRLARAFGAEHDARFGEKARAWAKAENERGPGTPLLDTSEMRKQAERVLARRAIKLPALFDEELLATTIIGLIDAGAL